MNSPTIFFSLLKPSFMKERLKNLGILKLGKELSKNEQKKITGGNFYCANSPMNCVQDVTDEVGYCHYVWNSYPVPC